MNTVQTKPTRSFTRMLNPREMTPRRAVIIAVIASLLLHLVIFTILVVWNFDSSKVDFAKDRLKQREVEMEVLKPDEPPPFTLQPAPEPQFIDSRGLDIAKDAAENPIFQSDENMRAASENPATGDIPLPSQLGTDRPFNAFQTQRSLLGPTAKPFTPVDPMPPAPLTPPPPPDIALQPPPTPAEEKAEEKPPTPDKEPAKPTDLRPVDKVTDQDIALTKKESKPTAVTQIQPTNTPPPVAHAAKLRPLDEPLAKLTTPAPKASPPPPPPQPHRESGYQPEQEQNHIEGNITNRGKRSVDSVATPMARYRKQVTDAIGSRWYYYIRERMDLVAFGSVRVGFVIDAQGHVSRVRVESNTSNQSLADVSTRAVRDAEIAPPPLDAAGSMSHEPLEWSLTFTYYPFSQ